MSGRIFTGVLMVLLVIAMPGAAEPSRVVQAEEILKKIELGQPVEYDSVIVKGDLDLSNLNLTKARVELSSAEQILGWPDYKIVVISPIRISNSVLEGSVNFKSAIFQNNIIFYHTLFKGPVYLSHSILNQTASFSFAQFNETAGFQTTSFNENADFIFAHFNQEADFDKAHFNQTASFENSAFNQTSKFISAHFYEYAHFDNARFNLTYFSFSNFSRIASFYNASFSQTADMRYAQFYQKAKFEGAQFDQTAMIWHAQFYQTGDFEKVRFNQTAQFWGAQFYESARFIGTRFIQTAEFNNAHFKLAEFKGARFDKTARFNSTQFNQTANFSGAQFNDRSIFEDSNFLNLYFNSTQFSQEAFFDSAQISGTLSLYRTKYDTLNIRWSSIHDLAYDDTAYHLLIQNFNKLGFGDDARECQYSYRCKHRQELWRQHKLDSWLFDLLAYATYGYGLRPVRPLGWAALFILMGGMFFFLTGSVTRSKESTEPAEKSLSAAGASQNKPDGNVSIWEALLLSATYFTSGASSIISATPSEFVPVGSGRYVVVLLRLLGWIFFVLFLSSLTRTV